MALTGDKKKEYQREYMRRRRSNKKDVRPDVTPPVRPIDELKAKYDVRQGDYKPKPPRSIYDVPVYDRNNKPESGDMVRVFRGKWIEVPYQETDADGNPMPD